MFFFFNFKSLEISWKFSQGFLALQLPILANLAPLPAGCNQLFFLASALQTPENHGHAMLSYLFLGIWWQPPNTLRSRPSSSEDTVYHHPLPPWCWHTSVHKLAFASYVRADFPLFTFISPLINSLTWAMFLKTSSKSKGCERLNSGKDFFRDADKLFLCWHQSVKLNNIPYGQKQTSIWLQEEVCAPEWQEWTAQTLECCFSRLSNYASYP